MGQCQCCSSEDLADSPHEILDQAAVSDFRLDTLTEACRGRAPQRLLPAIEKYGMDDQEGACLELEHAAKRVAHCAQPALEEFQSTVDIDLAFKNLRRGMNAAAGTLESAIPEITTPPPDAESADAKPDNKVASVHAPLGVEEGGKVSPLPTLLQRSTSIPSAPKTHSLSDLEQVRLQSAETMLYTARKCCRQGRITDAIRMVNTLESDAKAAREQSTELTRGQIVTFCKQLEADTDIKKLRNIYSRLEPFLAPTGLLAVGRRGGDWMISESRSKEIGEHFRLEVASRVLNESERDPNGMATQVVFRISLIDWPQRLRDFILLDREVDITSKETIKDCKAYVGQVGGPKQLMSSFLHYVVRPALLPVSLEFVQLREYAVCQEPPFSGCLPGVFVVEQTPPSGNFEGWEIPESSWGWKRLRQKSLKHFYASVEHGGCSSCVIYMKAEVPVSKWFAPIGLINNIVLTNTLDSFLNFKKELVDEWENHPYAARAQASPEFYGAVESLVVEEQKS